MSVASILAFVIAGAAAFKGKRDRAEESPKRTRYSELVIELGEVKGERDRQYEENVGLIARIAELEDAIATANVQARRDQELIDIWRERALAPIGALGPAGPDFRPPQVARQQSLVEQQSRAALQQQAHYQQLAAQSQLAQYNQQQAMNAQNFYARGLGQAQGLLGAQSAYDPELWCNCVPSRSQVWAADRSD